MEAGVGGGKAGAVGGDGEKEGTTEGDVASGQNAQENSLPPGEAGFIGAHLGGLVVNGGRAEARRDGDLAGDGDGLEGGGGGGGGGAVAGSGGGGGGGLGGGDGEASTAPGRTVNRHGRANDSGAGAGGGGAGNGDGCDMHTSVWGEMRVAMGDQESV